MTLNSLKSDEYRYKAFISYCHKDFKKAKWLQRRLELYSVPKGLLPKGERLYPIFLDRSELPASASLPKEIFDALYKSRYLIVVCSPDAAKSIWVDSEVRTFRHMGRDNRILALILDGDPTSTESDCCFPPALRELMPIAADIRPNKDGTKQAILKLAAGILNVGLEILYRRNAQYQVQKLRISLAICLSFLVVIGAFAWYALRQRDIAVAYRNHAEDVLAFLVYDLGDHLRRAQRPELADLVRQKVDDYYRELGPDPENLKNLAARATADENAAINALERGDLNTAMAGFKAGQAIREGLAARAPDEPAWLYDLAVSYAYVADTLAAQQDFSAAINSYRASIAVMERLRKSKPLSPLFQHQIAMSSYGIGIAQLAKGDPTAAMDAFTASFATAQRLVGDEKGNDLWLMDLSNANKGIGEVWMALQDSSSALNAFMQSALILEQLINRDSSNMKWLVDAGHLYSRIGQLRTDLSEWTEAMEAYQKALAVLKLVEDRNPNDGSAHANTLVTLINLALLQERANQPSEIDYWQRANKQAREMKRLGIPIEPTASAELESHQR